MLLGQAETCALRRDSTCTDKASACELRATTVPARYEKHMHMHGPLDQVHDIEAFKPSPMTSNSVLYTSPCTCTGHRTRSRPSWSTPVSRRPCRHHSSWGPCGHTDLCRKCHRWATGRSHDMLHLRCNQ